MAFCLLPQDVDKFKQALREGRVNPEELSGMSSDERHTFFSNLVGEENAQGVNSLFESKMLQKNQKFAYTAWAKKVAGISPEIRRDLITRIQKLDHVLDPGEEQQFLKDLAATKLGVNVTQEEASKIAELSRNIETTRGALENGGDRLEHGRAKVALKNYVSELKVNENKLNFKQIVRDPLGNAGNLAYHVAGNTKAINASMDDSAIFRQGWKTLWTHPGIWQRNARASFSNLVKSFGGKNVLDELHADILSRPNADLYQKAKLDVGNLEEAFPETLPEKVPLLGRAYKASEAAYTAFVQKTRADVFDKYIDIAQKTGVDTSNKTELQSIGSLVNSLTGRGKLGKLEPVAGTINNVFFSPRFLKSNLDLVLQPLGRGGTTTAFARKQAAMNLVKIAAGSATVLAIANTIKPGSVEWDPRSSDFGKIKIGDTRFDVTGGSGAIATLAARLAPLLIGKTAETKSSTTGQLTTLNSGKFGGETGFDVVTDFFSNKASPITSALINHLKGQDQNGNKPTLKGDAGNLFTPMGLQNWESLQQDPHSANHLVTEIIDGLGISSNTYGTTQSNWEQNPGKELSQFKQKVGDTEFKQANQEYNQKYANWVNSVRNNPQYTSLAPADQQSFLTTEKERLQKNIFQEHGFSYTKTKSYTPSSLLSPK